jgi:dihydrodipicolinate synthase/N-acetylneuraminate lyase
MKTGLVFKGVFPILPTPFAEDETLDLESFDRLVRFMVELGVNGVTIQPGVAIRKEIFRLRGLLRSSRVRHPGRGLDSATTAQLQAVLQAVLPDVDIHCPLSL